MILRNKKTGEITEEVYVIYDGLKIGNDLSERSRLYKSLADLEEDWEDYKPVEPLIKDEMVRKAVKAWAEACELDTAQYDEYWRSFRCDDCVIGFKTEDIVLNLDGGEWYTIAELCGEEEE